MLKNFISDMPETRQKPDKNSTPFYTCSVGKKYINTTINVIFIFKKPQICCGSGHQKDCSMWVDSEVVEEG